MSVTKAEKEALRKHLAKLGKLGGSTKGASKVRGDSDYYAKLAAKKKAKGK